MLAVLLSAGGANAVSVSVGDSMACAVLNDGKLKCWGNGSYLGIGSTGGSTRIPMEVDLGSGRTAKSVSIGKGFACVILDDDTLKCWGANNYGQLGVGDTTTRDAPTVVNLGSGRTAKAVVCAEYNTCVLMDDNNIKCWGILEYSGYWKACVGCSSSGKIESPRSDALDLGSGRTAKVMGRGKVHTCAILDDDTLKCWGANSGGELGTGSSGYYNDPGWFASTVGTINLGAVPTSVSVSPTAQTTCAILTGGAVKCWGVNSGGQLGDGTTTLRTTPIDVDLGAGYTAKIIETSTATTCAILNDDSIKCWGSNSGGEFGIGHTLDTAGKTTVPLPAGRTAKSISMFNSGYGPCAVLDDDTVWCWGTWGSLVPTRVCITDDDCAAPSGPSGPPGNDGSPGAAGSPGAVASGSNVTTVSGPPGPPGNDGSPGASSSSSSGNNTVYVYTYVNVSGPPGPAGPPGPGLDAYIDSEGNPVDAAVRRGASLPMLALSTVLYLLLY